MDPELPPYRPRKEVYAEMKEWIQKLAKPKKQFKPKPLWIFPKGEFPQAAVDKLSTGLKRKRYIPPARDHYSWVYKLRHPVKPEAMSYTATPKIEELARHRHLYVKPENDPYNWAYKLKHICKAKALKYEATERIRDLSQPKHPIKKYKKRRVRSVKRKALEAKASKRVVKLALPKMRKGPPPNEFAFCVKPIALKACCSARIRKLAQPKPLITELKERKPAKKKGGDDDDDDDD